MGRKKHTCPACASPNLVGPAWSACGALPLHSTFNFFTPSRGVGCHQVARENVAGELGEVALTLELKHPKRTVRANSLGVADCPPVTVAEPGEAATRSLWAVALCPSRSEESSPARSSMSAEQAVGLLSCSVQTHIVRTAGTIIGDGDGGTTAPGPMRGKHY